MAHRDTQATATIQELLVTALGTSDALAKLLIEKGIITKEEFLRRILEERMMYQSLLNPTVPYGIYLQRQSTLICGIKPRWSEYDR